MKTLLLDNYDSFTYNLYQYIEELGGNCTVMRNDAAVDGRQFDRIILSPGPGNPITARDVGRSPQLIEQAVASSIPLLGVCLGHQAIAVHFGGSIKPAPQLFHGRASAIKLQESALFANLPDHITAMRYHSLLVEVVPTDFKITARTADDLIMAMEHQALPIFGIQFHPESIGTPAGKQILKNFLNLP